MLKENEKRLLLELDKQEIPIMEQQEQYRKMTGQSKATFYRKRKEIGLKCYRRKSLYTGNTELGRCYFCKEMAKVIHHINKDRENNKPNNLLPLCISCHQKIHRIYGNLNI